MKAVRSRKCSDPKRDEPARKCAAKSNLFGLLLSWRNGRVGTFLHIDTQVVELFLEHVNRSLASFDCVHFLLCLCLFMHLPIGNVLNGPIRCLLGLRHDRRDKVPDRDDDVVAETWLLLRNQSGFSVAEEAGRHVVRLFDVALHEKLIEEKIRPLSQRLELSNWGRQIGCVDQEVETLLLACERFLVVLRVNDQVTVVAFRLDVFVLHFELHHVDLTCVVCHVCRQDHAHHSLSENFLFVIRKLLDEVVPRLEQQLHRLRCVPIFLNCFVVVPERAVCHEIHMVRVVIPIVVEVVARCCRDGRDQVQVVELNDLAKVPIFDEHVHALSNVCAMQIVVVLDLPSVALVDCI